jgi:hypothetical protein
MKVKENNTLEHPSKDYEVRADGFGIAAGIEKPYKGTQKEGLVDAIELYSPIPHSGYYGVGLGIRPFKKGQASFNDEIDWYKKQYGESTQGTKEK